MGICYVEAKLLVGCRDEGRPFGELLTIGHQALNLQPSEVAALAKGSPHASAIQSSLAGYSFNDYSDRFLRDGLGVERLDVLDYSDFEGATITHDLNHPVPDSMLGKYDVVVESGSVEHVFDVAAAVKNVMGMVKVGGTLLFSCPANNLCGHGFYQLSPELAFRIFTPENGYRLERLLVVESWYPSIELRKFRRVYEVTDPAVLSRRVSLMNSRPVTLVAVARRVAEAELFAPAPLQSDYVANWEDPLAESENWRQRAFRRFQRYPVTRRALGIRERRMASWANDGAFQRLHL